MADNIRCFDLIVCKSFESDQSTLSEPQGRGRHEHERVGIE